MFTCCSVLVIDELRVTQEQLAVSNNFNVELKDKLWRQSAELDDVKTAAAVSEAGKLDEIEQTRRHCEEEIATLQQLIRGRQLYIIVLANVVECAIMFVILIQIACKFVNCSSG